MPSPTTSIEEAAEILAALATLSTTTPGLEELAAELGRPVARLSDQVVHLERCDLVESWRDPARLGSRRVMLSARSLARLRLRLSAKGDRWETVGNPDRPPRRPR